VPNFASYQVISNSTYPLTGAFGALGMQLSKLLVERGAKYLIQVSRRGAVSENAKSIIQPFKAKGVEVSVLALDISKQDIPEKIYELVTLKAP
ncbi:unnamed protein product, partial [Choristocarpus tenellus]